MRFQMTKQDKCNAYYNDLQTGEKVHLWIIVGGEPAIDFENYGFTVRDFPVEPEPDAFDYPDARVLPNGEQDLADFVDTHLPNKKRREYILGLLPSYKYSARLHDTTDHSYYKLEIEFRGYIPRITVWSNTHSGLSQSDDIARAHYSWGNLSRLLFALESKYGSFAPIESLTDDEVKHLCDVVNGLK